MLWLIDWLIDWLINYGFTSRSRVFHLYGDVTIAGEGLQNLGLCSALRAFEQGGIFIVPHLLWHGTSVFPVSSEGPSIQSPRTTHEGVWVHATLSLSLLPDFPVLRGMCHTPVLWGNRFPTLCLKILQHFIIKQMSINVNTSCIFWMFDFNNVF